ncbi:MAG: dihydrolipoyllysine-residue acetyltransferase [SAR92 clade bacterium]|uniref:Dihydrolipoamide acetyltransferase component of pyruvate dehydrogenase complex n=1 Tax=SAR92 clade bacterium TaxID=2315479 RepID=A0A520MD57_9GAMM|nr:MAG: dihydrolipoyllysine-residue acetyltransferase [SAR92 clade bacterium]
MNKDFILPDIGEGIVECEVLEWKVKEGDLVEEDQVIADVSTDKAIVEIPSMHSGRVTKLYYIAGETAKVHSPLYAIDIDGEDVELPNQEIETQEHKLELVKQPINVTQSEINKKVLTTPAVRKLAREHDLDLNLISGSGKSGRILKEDVLEYLKPDLKAPLLSLTKTIEDRSETIVGVRKIMAHHMADSVATIPHFTFVDDVDVTELLKLRASLKSRYTEEVKITLMPLLIKALSLSISAFPIVNSRVDDNFSELTYLASHNIGMAVDGKTGLLVPNIKDVQQRSIIDIAHEVTRLTDAARSGVINPSDLKDGTITISNIGAIGGVSASPIINKPEVAIVALGKIQKLPRFNDEGQLEERHIMTMSWSGDHRVIDGATIARFNNSWKAYLENPSTMLANMV